MTNVFRYRSNGKWYTFDKSILDPQDTAIFDKMSYPDKLKLITIYTQLKPKENDDVVILKTRKEDSKKDVRRAEYLKKKEKIEEDITKATKANKQEDADKAIEQLNKLNVEYADVVGITAANEVNVAKANKVVLQDVKQLITQVNDGVNALKSDISEASFTQLKNTIKQLLDAKTASDTKEIIEQMAATLDELKASDRAQSTKDTADAVKASVEELKTMLEVDPENKTLEEFVNWLGNFTKGEQEQAYILQHSRALALMSKYGITLADTKRVATYPFAKNAIANAAKTYDEAFIYYKRMANYISYYLTLQSLSQNQFLAIVNEEAKNKKESKPSSYIPEENYISATLDSKLKFEVVYNNLISKFTFNGIPHKEYVYKHRIRDTVNDKASERKTWVFVQEMVYYTDGDAKIDDPDMEKIMSSPRREELNKPGAIETEGRGILGAGWFGIQTKKDSEAITNRLLGIIDELKGQIKQNKEDINRLFQRLNEKEAVVAKEDIRPQQVKPSQLSPSFLSDITKPITLKQVRRLKKEPDEVDDLVKALNKRRIDIEYSDDSDDDYVWGDGVEQLPLKGGVLAELKRDLEKYGLVFNPSKDGKSYYLTVFNRKKDVSRSGAGVEEAKQCVDFAKQHGNEMKYTNLKELYEDIY